MKIGKKVKVAEKCMFSILFLSLLMGSVATSVFGHAGHDKVPGQGGHGGVMKGTTDYYFEMTKDGSEIRIYPYTDESKALNPKDVSIEMFTVNSKTKKKEKVDFKKNEEFFETKVDLKGASHLPLIIESKHGKKTERVEFQIEAH